MNCNAVVTKCGDRRFDSMWSPTRLQYHKSPACDLVLHPHARPLLIGELHAECRQCAAMAENRLRAYATRPGSSQLPARQLNTVRRNGLPLDGPLEGRLRIN